jgi:transcriptional regulator with XRE-family HTH domain
MSRQQSFALARRLKQLRRAADLSVYELANLAGINRSTLQRIETGINIQPGTDTLNALARALQVDAEELYDALWQAGAQPLPSPATYFRSKYRLNAAQIAQLESQIRKATGTKGSKYQASKHERRSP